MEAKDLRKLLEETDNKLDIFSSTEILKQYNFKAKELFDLIGDFLTDEEKLKLFGYPYFQGFDAWAKGRIIELVSDESVKLKMLSNDSIIKDMKNDQVIDYIKNLNDEGKEKILRNQEFLEKHQFTNNELKDIVLSLGDEVKLEILTDNELVEDKLHLSELQITEIAKGLSSEESKIKVLETCKLEKHFMFDIVENFSNEKKIQIILEEKKFNKCYKIIILDLLDVHELSGFLEGNKEFCIKNDIHPYEVVKALDSEKQKDFVARLEGMDLTLSEKREILVSLPTDVKESLDTTNLPEEYKTAISIQTKKYVGKVIFDLEREMEDYRGLDNLMVVNPEQYTDEQRAKFIQLCDICPNLQVVSTLKDNEEMTSTVSEYKDAEEWISSIVDNLDPEYSKVQKMAVIDYAIGKKISYSPDFDTELFNQWDCRALWKIISSGYGICNGVAKVEQYILGRAGIESEMIDSETHTFLKIKDIEIPLANGETAKGNTLLDPTWNLQMHRFGGQPYNFCKSYTEIRKNDIDINGKDHKCHKNDEALQDVTLNLDEKSLRKLFTSVGLADKDGQFPIKNLIEESKKVDEIYSNQPNQNINEQFSLLSKICPEFATCEDSSMSILKDVLLNNENLNFNKCVANRVYNITDKEKKPVLYVYMDSDELGRKFYFADKTEGQFVELPQEEFVKQFECYEKDLENINGIRPWEAKEQGKEEIDLARSSGKVVVEGGEER